MTIGKGTREARGFEAVDIATFIKVDRLEQTFKNIETTIS